MNLEPEIPKRGLTRFLCQELLYDYVAGELDPRREAEVAKYLKTCKDSQRELEKIKRALSFTESAKGLTVGQGLHSALLNFEPQWQKNLRRLTQKFSNHGWKLMPYMALVATVVVGLVAFKPWQIHQQQEAILAEQLKKEPDMLPPAPEPLPQPAPINESPALSATPVTPTLLMARPDNLVALNPKALPPTPPPTPQPVAVASSSQSTSEAEASTPSAESEAVRNEKPATSGAKGFLMRGEMEVSDFHNTWPAIRDKVQALGGKTAGNVELGWLRTPTQSYFHFALPESNYSELELFLGTFGPVRFSNERHPRVMPQGQIRIILTVKEGVGNEGSAETP